MRIKTYRSLAFAMLFLPVDLVRWYFAFPSELLEMIHTFFALTLTFLGMIFVFICSVLLMEYTMKYSRAATFVIITAFIRGVLITGIASAEWLVLILELSYHAFLVLMVLILCDATATVCRNFENLELIRWCDRTGYIYALHFLLYIGAAIFPDLRNMFILIDFLITFFCAAMFFAFFVNIHTQVEAVDIQSANVDLDEYETALKEAAELSYDDTEE